jgi:RecA-family ATPase
MQNVVPFEPYDPTKDELTYDWKTRFHPLLSNNWLVKGVIPTTGSGIIYGPPGCGKTFLCMDLCLHLACGLTWAGFRTKTAKVCYMAAEGGSRVINRVAAWEKERQKVESGFNLLVEPVDVLGEERLDVLDDLKDLKPNLLVIDTLNRVMRGGNENSPEDMGRVIAMLSHLESELECFILVVHHSGKDATRGFRGHSSLLGAIDTQIEIKDYQFVVTKQRDGEMGKSVGFGIRRVELGIDEDNDPVTSCVIDYVRDYY